MNNFKLLAIKPIHGCDKSILKILKSGQFYFFDNSYVPTKDQRWITRREENVGYIPEKFFYTKRNFQSSLDQVNVQALVGKNGEGKSSLTELALRIFNNFFKLKKVHEVTDKLALVKNLFAELYFSIDQQVFRIRTENDQSDFPTAILETIGPDNAIREEAEVLSKLFFVMNVNYSHYSLNSMDFQKETLLQKRYGPASWLDCLFHRNDGYQTPLTIHPFRKEGNIDVNNERSLINQRLMTLILTESSYETINDNLKVKEIVFERFKTEPILNEITQITSAREMEEAKDFDQSDSQFHNLSLITDEAKNQYFIKELLSFIDDWTPPSFRRSDIGEISKSWLSLLSSTMM